MLLHCYHVEPTGIIILKSISIVINLIAILNYSYTYVMYTHLLMLASHGDVLAGLGCGTWAIMHLSHNK